MFVAVGGGGGCKDERSAVCEGWWVGRSPMLRCIGCVALLLGYKWWCWWCCCWWCW